MSLDSNASNASIARWLLSLSAIFPTMFVTGSAFAPPKMAAAWKRKRAKFSPPVYRAAFQNFRKRNSISAYGKPRITFRSLLRLVLTPPTTFFGNVARRMPPFRHDLIVWRMKAVARGGDNGELCCRRLGFDGSPPGGARSGPSQSIPFWLGDFDCKPLRDSHEAVGQGHPHKRDDSINQPLRYIRSIIR